MEQTTQEELDKLSKEEKEKIFKDEQWHPAEIRRQDVLDLLNNTKKLAEMYGDFLAIKREGWERILEGKRKTEERRKNKEQNG